MSNRRLVVSLNAMLGLTSTKVGHRAIDRASANCQVKGLIMLTMTPRISSV